MRNQSYSEKQMIEAAWLFHVAHAPKDAPKQFREALFEKFDSRSTVDDLLASLREAICVADEVHGDGCACIAALVPCDCWLSRAKSAVDKAEGRSYSSASGGPSPEPSAEGKAFSERVRLAISGDENTSGARGGG